MTSRCPNCRKPLLANKQISPLNCAHCGGEFRWTCFPALEAETERGAAAEAVVLDGQACCFYHEKKKAAVSCDFCGRFLCALCDLDWGGKHVCPSCFENKRNAPAPTGQASAFTDKIVRYDSIAMGMAGFGLLASLFLWFISFIFWPAIFIAILFFMRYSRNKSRSLITPPWRMRLHWYASLGIALTASIGSIVLGVFFISSMLKKS